MDRRTFFRQARQGLSQKPIASRSLASGLDEYTGTWTYAEASHLLKRTMFGSKKEDVDHFLTLTPAQAVDELLNTHRSVTPPLRDYGSVDDMGTPFNDPGASVGATWVNDLNTSGDDNTRGLINKLRIDSLRKWWAGLIITQQRSIDEKMVLFWHHHFSVQREEVNNANYLYRHHMLLRDNILGNARQLTKDVTIDGAMLVHLNGYLNSKRAPDENYARELQELFTVGKGNDSAYTESDVREAARVLTGWRLDSDTQIPYLETGEHDTGTKTFSSFYNNTTISGSSDGKAEMGQLINMIFATQECARFICRKLYKWFVYYQIDSDTETNVIAPLADIFRNNNFEIKPVLEALLKSEHFFDKANRACYIKSPYDFMVGALRELDVSFPAYTDYTNGYPVFNSIYEQAAAMQQDLFQPPDVSGWPSYYQEPMQYELWVNSNSLPKRADFTDGLINEGLADVQLLLAKCSDPSDRAKVIDEISNILLRYPLTDASKTYILNNFLSDTGNASMQQTVKFILNLPEYHLC